MTDSSNRPPEGLGDRGGRFWRLAVDAFEFSDAEREVLVEVCRTLDTVDVLEGRLSADGPMTVGSKGQPVAHPALAEVRQMRALLVRLLTALDLPDEDAIVSATSERARKAATTRWDMERARTGINYGGGNDGA